MNKRMVIAMMIVSIAFLIIGCEEAQQTTQTPLTKPAITRPKIKPRAVTVEERKTAVEYILKNHDSMRIKLELESNLKKLEKDRDAGEINLSTTEFEYIKKNFTNEISHEEKEIKAFKDYLDNLDITIIGSIEDPPFLLGKAGSAYVKGIENDVNRITKYNCWTEKPSSEKEIRHRYIPKGPLSRQRLVKISSPLKMYRFDWEGNKYLYAVYHYAKIADNMTHVDIFNRDGMISVRIFMNALGNPFAIKTSIGKDRWIDWPVRIEWAWQRSILIWGDRKTWKNAW